ncbi:MAG: hypothetical protein AAF483_04310 [Planctomycetota bacterium]
MSNVTEQTAADNDCWTSDLVTQVLASDSMTIGILNASRWPNNPRAIHQILNTLSQNLTRRLNEGDHSLQKRILCIQLKQQTEFEQEPQNRIPVAQRSPLGDWSEVSVEIYARKDLGRRDERVQQWLPEWKDAFPFIVLDLGAIDSKASHNAARLCDCCYLMLGPEECGSHQWLMQQMQLHQNLGTNFGGSLLAGIASDRAEAA